MRVFFRTIVTVVGVVSMGLVVWAGSAQAATTFAQGGEGAGQVSDPAGVAVDQSTGAAYVADTSNARVDEFSKEGAFVLAWGWGVANHKDELQTCTSSCESGTSGTGAGEFELATSVAVDNSGDSSDGDVYVADSRALRVQKFTAEGKFELTFGREVDKTKVKAVEAKIAKGETPSKAEVEAENVCTAASGDTCGAGLSGTEPGALENQGSRYPLAVDASGDVWVGDVGRLDEFSAAGAFMAEVKLTEYEKVSGLAIDTDPASLAAGDFYVLSEPNAQDSGAGYVGPEGGSGSYTLTFDGETTKLLPARRPITGTEVEAALEVQNALEELPSIGSGNVSVFSAEETENSELFNITFVGALANMPVPPLTASNGIHVNTSEGHPAGPVGLFKLEPFGGLTGEAKLPVETLDEAGHPNAIGLDPATGDLFISDEVSPTSHKNNATLLEYDSSGAELESFGTGEVLGNPVGDALAFGDSAKSLYVVGPSSGAQIFPAFPPGPLVVPASTAASAFEKTGATLHATVNPEDHATTYQFQYVDEADFNKEGGFASAHTVTSTVSALAGEAFEAQLASFEVEAGKLTPATTYRFRVIAHNERGTADGELNREGREVPGSFTTLPPAAIDSTSVSTVTATTAVLAAEVNPLGDETTYHFEYLPQSQFEAQGGFAYATSAPVPAASLGSGEAGQPASQPIQDLEPHTVYRYRVVANNSHEGVPYTVAGESNKAGEEVVHTFTTQGAGEFVLPDHRQYEMVSPPDKDGALLYGIDQAGSGGDVIQTAPDGDAITYVADSPTEPEPAGYSAQTQVFSTRGPSGWSTHDLTIPQSGSGAGGDSAGGEYQFFSEDLSSAIVQPYGPFIACNSSEGAVQPCLSAEAIEQTAFLHNIATGAYTPLVTRADDMAEPFESFGGESVCVAICGPRFVSATSDDKHVIFESEVALTPGGDGGLYEWSGAEPPSRQLAFVSVLPDQEGGGPEKEGASLGGAFAGNDARGAISSDGSRVFFKNETQGYLYVRELSPHEQTLRLGLPEAACAANGTCGQGNDEPRFQFASPDGSRVLFTDEQRLTAASGADDTEDLYECELREAVGGALECKLTDLTPQNASGESADVQGVVGASEDDNSYVYFVANGVLENDGARIADAHSGQPNVYLRHDGTTSLVAVLSDGDYLDWPGGFEELSNLTAQVSPNGQYLAFMSDRELTGYDNHDVASGEPDEEVYEYDAVSSTLSCASCDPSGARPAGASGGGLIDPTGKWGSAGGSDGWLAANVPGWTPFGDRARYQSRYLSNTGRLFFNAHAPLVPNDVNNQWDVYEYEPEGLGSCTSSTSSGSDVFKPAHTVEIEGRGVEEGAGCVGLISNGESKDESAFLDASASGGKNSEGAEGGGDVFFLTTAKLAPQDVDDSYDVYDAHECTVESQCTQAATTPAPCNNEASCKPAPEPQPSVYGLPASATFSGPGNLAPPPLVVVKKVTKKTAKCRRGFVRKKVKKKAQCVKVKSKGKAKKSSHGRGGE
jgi:hypothetical protein